MFTHCERPTASTGFFSQRAGLFGSKTLPRIRATIGDVELDALGKQQQAKSCVLVYMQNRKAYDRACNETEETVSG